MKRLVRSARSCPAACPLPVPSTVTAARALLQTFAARGVRFAFGIPGGLISPVFDALADVPEIRLVSTRHESMAVFCAMGSTVATGSPALVLTTSGPGITNAVTGLAAAIAEEIPVILVGGEVSSSAWARGAFQDCSTNSIDSVALLRTVTRWSARVDSPAGAVGAAAHAMQIAESNRPGPVFLSVALNVGNGQTRFAPVAAPELQAPLRPDPAACGTVAAALRSAKRPLLVLGNGARTASQATLELAERLSIPVVTTPHAKGVFPESHRLHLGVIGFGGHPSATNYLASRPDVACVVGSRLGDFATNGWTLSLGGSVATFQIDRDARLIGRNYPVTLGIVGDATQAVEAILAHLPQLEEEDDRLSGVYRLRGIRRIETGQPCDRFRGLEPAAVLEAFQQAFPDAFWASDIGEHCAHALHHLRIERPDQFRAMLGFGSMGSGIGVAMGVALADTTRPVISVCGDGGFAMHAGDLLTCVEQGIGCLFLVMNDGRWNIVEHGFRAVFGRVPHGLAAHVADLAGVARHFGATGVTIERPDQLNPENLRALVLPGKPVVADVRIDPGAVLSVDTRSTTLRQSAFGGAQ